MFDQDGDKVYIYHTKPGQLSKGYRATVALKKVGDNTYKVGISICSPSDQFCKKTGLDKASGRAKSRRYHVEVSGPRREVIIEKVFDGIDSMIKSGETRIEPILEVVNLKLRFTSGEKSETEEEVSA